MKKYYIPVAIPYLNADPHIGHALEAVYADVLARYYRKEEYDVFLSMGTDEHGEKIARAAEVKGVTPQQHVDELAQRFTTMWDALGVSYSDSIRTTQERHKQTAQHVWKQIQEKGDIEKGVYEGWYCVGCEAYKTEKELEEGNCPIHKKPVERIQEENYFFRLSRYQQHILDFYEAHPDFVLPKSRLNEVKELVRQGLEDVPVSRQKEKMSWGIPVPGDENHVMYVWFEALINYLSVIGYGNTDHEELFTKWWPADMHIVGKDINRFHSVMWVAMLLSAEIELPKHVGVHGFITVEGQKMSKSIGNVIDPFELVQQYGAEPVRFYFMRDLPFFGDGDFTYSKLEERYNADLANGIGNLLSRVTNMVEKYFYGELDAQPLEENYAEEGKKKYHHAMRALEFHKALEVVFSYVNEANEYIEQQKPWDLAKHDHEKLRVVLQHLLFCLELFADWLMPFIPHTAQKISDAIEIERIQKAQPLFPRLEKE